VKAITYKRAFPLAAIAATVMALASACSPGNTPLAAMSDAEGGTVLVQVCVGVNANWISVTDVDDKTAVWSVSGNSLYATSATLFKVPKDWKLEEEKLSGLAAGHRYYLDIGITGSTKASYSGMVFAADDLSSLAAGKVMAADGKGRYDVVTEKEFRDRSKAAC
jgi:hypothetical protein